MEVDRSATSLPRNKTHHDSLQTDVRAPGAITGCTLLRLGCVTEQYLCCIYSLQPFSRLSRRAVWKLQLFPRRLRNSTFAPSSFKEVGAQVGQICLDLYIRSLNNSCCDIHHFSRDTRSFLGLKTFPPLDRRYERQPRRSLPGSTLRQRPEHGKRQPRRAVTPRAGSPSSCPCQPPPPPARIVPGAALAAATNHGRKSKESHGQVKQRFSNRWC